MESLNLKQLEQVNGGVDWDYVGEKFTTVATGGAGAYHGAKWGAKIGSVGGVVGGIAGGVVGGVGGYIAYHLWD